MLKETNLTQVHRVRDGVYGAPKKEDPNDWTGMVGELIRGVSKYYSRQVDAVYI